MAEGNVWRRRLKELMEQMGWNQSDLASKLDVTPGYVSQLFSGYRDLGKSTAYKLSKLFHVPIGIILGDELPERRVSVGRRENIKVPLISWVKASRYNVMMDMDAPDFGEEWVSVDTDDSTAFALRISTGDNAPFLSPQDIVVVSPRWEVRNNEFGLVLIDDTDMKIRRVARSDDILILTSYQGRLDIIRPTGRARIVGRLETRITRL